MNSAVFLKQFHIKMLLGVIVFAATCYLLSITFLPPVSANAQIPTAPTSTRQTTQQSYSSLPDTDPSVPTNLNTWTQTVMIQVLAAVTCQLTGYNPVGDDRRCLGVDTKTGQIGFVEHGGGAIGVVGNMISTLYTPPFHSTDYFMHLANNFGLAKPAHAQTGAGLDSLTPVASLWIAFRNMTYMVFIVIFVLIGLAIMLRIKIDPRTVMTIQNQIPRIIIGIIFVTFSFAIAGFLIDLMYVGIYLIFNLFSSSVVASSDTQAAISYTLRTYNNDNALGVFNNLANLQKVVSDSSGAVKVIVQNLLAIDTVSNPLDIIRNGIGAIAGWIMGTLALLIIGIAVLVAMFRLWFSLILAYVFFLIDVILGPFFIAAGIVPGGPYGVGGWLRSIISNLAVFPTTIFLFLLGRVLMDSSNYTNSDSVFVPPLIGDPGPANVVGTLIGLGVILLTPQVVAMVKAALKAPQNKYLAGIGQALGSGAGLVRSSASIVIGTALTNTPRYDEHGKIAGITSWRHNLLRRLFG